jgi:glycosyltransferase involved in cell wall biosynthesis
MNPGPPLLSVVIPSFNRADPLKFTLRSVDRAAAVLGGAIEVLLVDDGSSPPMAEQLAGFDVGPGLKHIRQANQGSIVARLTGLGDATGEYVLFLDSDDLVHPDKFARQLAAMQQAAADVSYADMALATPGADHQISSFEAAEALPETDIPATLFIEIQPAPHNPIYRRDYLMKALANPLVVPDRAMDPSGDVWLFYNLAIFPAKITKVNGPYSAPGPHGEDRYSRHWESLGVAALRVMEAFIRTCPRTTETFAARQAAGEAAFRSWRALPRGYNAGFVRSMLAVYQQAPHGPCERLGTPDFARLARLLGPVAAGRLMRALRARPYKESRTLTTGEYEALLAGFDTAP